MDQRARIAGAKNGFSGETLRRAYLTDAASYWKKVLFRSTAKAGAGPGAKGESDFGGGSVARFEPEQRQASSAGPRPGSAAQKALDPRSRSFEERGFDAARDRRRLRPYWPPQGEALELPGGRKQVQVLTAKSDVDGALEAQLAFLTRGGHRLFYLNEEELAELEKLAPRISEYFELWEEKAKEAAESEDSKRLHRELQQRPLE
ncbi:unnamed protein product [Symbiodinium necroappetens]|uniref:Uncharacterized protein n=1 Tax=Symbiodinium necroappetens TaxID=1628268 RepID=A0A812LS30_9DINO|nr:unnamed protein product [Symbiodinium necroappetens]